MTANISPSAVQAFEERFATSQNSPDSNEGRLASIKREEERSNMFVKTEPITDILPTPAAQLAAIVELANHLARSRTSPYRVRRQLQRSSSHFERHYVPSIDSEFAFCALELWCIDQQRSAVLTRDGVMHPAAKALIDFAERVLTNGLLPKYLSREEHNTLSESQQRRNLVAEYMRDWYASPDNKHRVKLWNEKYRQAKEKFLTDWSALARLSDACFLRADLTYSPASKGFAGANRMRSREIRLHVARFITAVRANPLFAAGKCLVHPYVDLYGGWHLPLLACAPEPQTGLGHQLQQALLKQWRSATEQDHASAVWQPFSMECTYRFISDEQRAFDNPQQHLGRAAAYFFESRVLADTHIDVISPAQEAL
ncbi:hypothetical protein [Alicycliphilus denitrificans]|uniref:hypothetical protein n=1 Tax=Alicycliphilus denitrificans TaxID=179636 RepID=UPI000A4C41F4|nr:hypothetical protein [Alicycliphilus denitrificans]MBN9576310.1 hypothetical protein [Alicycliphilus denitrificans]